MLANLRITTVVKQIPCCVPLTATSEAPDTCCPPRPSEPDGKQYNVDVSINQILSHGEAIKSFPEIIIEWPRPNSKNVQLNKREKAIKMVYAWAAGYK